MSWGNNPVLPQLLTPDQTIAELAEILAAGLMRAVPPKSSPLSPDSGESSLHLAAAESGDPLNTDAENRQ